MLISLFTFLEVNVTEIINDNQEYNVSGFPRNIFLHNLLNKNNVIKKLIKPISKYVSPKNKLQKILSKVKKNNLKKIAMNNDTRKKLENIFQDDVNKLSFLIGKDLSHWS